MNCDEIDMEAAERVSGEIELHGSINEALAYRIAREFHPDSPENAHVFITKTVETDWSGDQAYWTVSLHQHHKGYGLESRSRGVEVVLRGFGPRIKFKEPVRDFDFAMDVLARVKKLEIEFNDDLYHRKYRDMDPEKRARKMARRRVMKMWPGWCSREAEHYIDMCIGEGRSLDEIGVNDD